MSDTTTRYQRIASAIYLVTGFFSDQEPLKWRLRTLSADLVGEAIKDKGQVTREINGLFNIAKNAGIVSEPNYLILCQELAKIESELAKPVELPLLPVSQVQETKIALKEVKPEPKEPEPAPEAIKDKVELLPSIEKPSLREFGAVSVKKNNRQSIIIGLLKRKKEIMIKDVSPLIQGCSEKTIQRELSEMVYSGILRKTGEKRWTRYSLN